MPYEIILEIRISSFQHEQMASLAEAMNEQNKVLNKIASERGRKGEVPTHYTAQSVVSALMLDEQAVVFTKERTWSGFQRAMKSLYKS